MDEQQQHLELTDSVEIAENAKGEPRVSVKVRSTPDRDVHLAAEIALALYEQTTAKLAHHRQPV